ncbi:hypothetical protein ACFQX7_08600 [Luedemannella flava]
MRVRHDTLHAIFDGVYVALMSNLLLVLGCLPLVAALFTTETARSWPLYALLAPLCAPGVCGVFAVMSAYSSGRSTAVLRTFGRTWRATGRRAVLWGPASAPCSSSWASTRAGPGGTGWARSRCRCWRCWASSPWRPGCSGS